MTRPPSALLPLVLLASCFKAPSSTTAPSLTCPPIVRPVPPNWGDGEPDSLARLAGMAERDGLSLRLGLVNGHTVVLRDSVGDSVSSDAFVRYRLVTFWRDLRAFEVEVGAWEGGATLLLDRDSGHRTYLWGSPILAPGHARLAAISYDLAAQYDPNGIQIWARGRDTLRLEWQTYLSDWGPSDAHWVDSTTLVVRRNGPFAPLADTVGGCAVLSRRGGSWTLTIPHP